MASLKEELLELGGDITGSLEDVAMPAMLLDRAGRVLWQNKASVALRGNVIGSEFAELAPADEHAVVRAAVAEAVANGRPRDLSVTARTVDGGRARLEACVLPVRDGGAVVGIFGLGRIVQRGDEQTWAPRASAGEELGLTERQQEILGLLADGRSTDEIAKHLWLSRTTVRNHIANIIAVLGVHSRLQAVVKASKSGLFHHARP